MVPAGIFLMRALTQYAYAWCGERVGPWRSDRGAAELDALREGRAQRDRHNKRIFLTVPAHIVTRLVEAPVDADNVARLGVKPRFRLVGREFV